MNYIVERNTKISKYEYRLNGENVWAKTSHTLGILFRKFYIYFSNEEYVLKETNVLLKLLNYLPLFRYLKYDLIKNDGKIGHIKRKAIILASEYELYMYDEKYVFYLGKNNRIIVINNDREIAYICKRYISYNEKNTYDIEIISEDKGIINVVFIITIFSDIIFFPNYFQYSGMRWEKTF